MTGLAALALATVASTTLGGFFQPQLSADDLYSESFAINAMGSDGSYVNAVISISNIGPGAHNAFCRATIAHDGQPIRRAVNKSSAKNWQYVAPKDALIVTKCTLQSTGTSWSLEISDPRTPLRLQADGPPRPLDVPSQYFRSVRAKGQLEARLALTSLARATEAKISIGGAPATAAQVYLEHSRSFVKPGDAGLRVIRFRSFDHESPLWIVQRDELGSESSPTGFVWSERSGFVSLNNVRSSLVLHGTTFEVTLNAEKVSLHNNSTLYRNAPIEDAGLLGRLLKSLIGSPVTWGGKATATYQNQQRLGVTEASFDESNDQAYAKE